MGDKLIQNYNYNQIQDPNNILLLNENIKEDELNNFKYIPNNKKIKITLYYNTTNLEKILDKILELDLNVNLTIIITDKNYFNKSNIFKTNKYDNMNINVISDFSIISLLDYKFYENVLYELLKPIENKNYSPFEKYVYAYNITKKYKKYNECDRNNPSDSRTLYKILFNDYIVCVGFSLLLSDLLNKLNIENETIGVSFINENIQENNNVSKHRRLIVHIQDDKYNIDGYYYSDPTSDNNLENDFYNFIALTSKENLNTKIMFKSNLKNDELYVSELFEIDSANDFFNKVNYIINFKMISYTKECKDNNIKPDYRKKIKEIYLDIINKILFKFKNIDKIKCRDIINKFNLMRPKQKIINDDKFYDIAPIIIEELGNYISKKVNNEIPGNVIIYVARIVNNDLFNMTEEEKKNYENEFRKLISSRNIETLPKSIDYFLNNQKIQLENELIISNKIRQNKLMPKKTIENLTTGEITYENEENKFRI